MSEFELVPTGPARRVVPIEPLYSMLHDAPMQSLEYLHNDLNRYSNESELDDIVENIGISRRKAIEQTMLVLSQRKHSID